MGIGGEPLSHPMADAKLLETALDLHGCGVLSDSRLKTIGVAAAARLRTTARPSGEGLVWRLNFPWSSHGYTREEPLLINSALVCSALSRLNKSGIDLRGLDVQSVAGLRHWCESETSCLHGVDCPVYGLSAYRVPVLNTTLSAFAALKTAGWTSPVADHFANSAWDSFHEGIGWDYESSRPVVDLLHQWYILRSFATLRGRYSIADRAVEVIGQFRTPNEWLDVLHRRDPLTASDDNPKLIRRRAGANWVLVTPKPARLWSLGETLLGVSEIISHQNQPQADYLTEVSCDLATIILDRMDEPNDIEVDFPRHVFHATHGLAAFISLARKNA